MTAVTFKILFLLFSLTGSFGGTPAKKAVIDTLRICLGQPHSECRSWQVLSDGRIQKLSPGYRSAPSLLSPVEGRDLRQKFSEAERLLNAFLKQSPALRALKMASCQSIVTLSLPGGRSGKICYSGLSGEDRKKFTGLF